MGMTDSWLPNLQCRPANGVLDCKGPLSDTTALNTLAEVNKEVKLTAAGQKKKRGSNREGASSPV